MSSALAAAILLLVSSVDPRTFAVTRGTLSYRIVHKLHEVSGSSRSLEGKARVLPDGTVQVMVRAPLRSFDSGNGNRDAHMLEVTDAAAQPYVILKAIGRLAMPTSFPADVELPLQGELTLKSPQPVEIATHVHFEGPDRLEVKAAFPVSLDAHRVERPALLFVKIEDRVEVETSLAMEAER